MLSFIKFWNNILIDDDADGIDSCTWSWCLALDNDFDLESLREFLFWNANIVLSHTSHVIRLLIIITQQIQQIVSFALTFAISSSCVCLQFQFNHEKNAFIFTFWQ
jgi:hypothetical protein